MPPIEMADEHEVAQVERVDRGVEVRRVIPVEIRRRLDCLAVAVAAQVDRAHVEIGDEARCDVIEPVRMRSTAVHAQHRRRPSVRNRR